jgi:hypothetical protein
MLGFHFNPMRIPSVTFLAVAAVFSGCLTHKDADHAEARSKPAQPVEPPFVLSQAVAPSIYGPPVMVTDFDSERPLGLSLIPARVAIRVAGSVKEPMELPSLPTSPLPRAVQRPEFLIDGRVQSLPE